MYQERPGKTVLQDGKEDTDEEVTIDDSVDEVENGNAEDAIGERHGKYRERIRHFVLMNDPLARVAFNDNPTLEYLLRVTIKKPDLAVVSRIIQADYKNLEGRSVVMDIVARDSSGVVYNIEIQQKSEGSVPERVRYHVGMVDAKELHENEDFTKLPNSFFIFITDKGETERILSDEKIPAAKGLEGQGLMKIRKALMSTGSSVWMREPEGFSRTGR